MVWDENQKGTTMSFNRKVKAKNAVHEFNIREHSEQEFVDELIDNRTLVQVHLINSQRLVGKILGSDEFTILLSRQKPGNQMIYKSSITTISAFERKENEQ
jgi:RNA chaperone Hfq